ncbi:MAG: oligosaccharide flippase family protein [Elusimicrobia bacterium]|nr:oligosaccharide flippase family protein [Elusimicrobiota bacterium]
MGSDPLANIAGRARLAALPETGRRFLAGFSWIALFFAGARASSLASQFLAGRVLGPEEFGRAHLITGMAATVQILPMLGFPFALSRLGGQSDRPGATAAALSAFFVWAALCVGILAGGGAALAPLTGLSAAHWNLCLALSAATALHLTLGGALQGLTRFKERGLSEALYGLASFGTLAVWLSIGRPSAGVLLGSTIAGLSAAALFSLWLLRGQLRATLSAAPLREILPFAALGAFSLMTAALIQTPGRVVLFHLDSARASGIYAAYFMATVQVALALVNMLQAVLIPLASRTEGQREAWDLVRGWWLPAAAALPGVFAVGAGAVIGIMGRSYPKEPLWILLFALAASAILLHSVLAALFAARDMAGLLTATGAGLGAGLLNLLLTLSLAPRLGVAGAALGLAVSHCASAGLLLALMPRRA